MNIKARFNIFIFLLLLLTTNAKLIGQAYCTPTYTTGNIYGDYISSFVLGSINNPSGQAPSPNFYSDFTALSSNLALESNYTISITSGTYPSDSFFVWIDYNHDLDFYDAGEIVGRFKSTAASQTNTITFKVPGTALLGSTRLRVRCIWNVSAHPCNTFTYGETEDYSVSIIPQFSPITSVGLPQVNFTWSSEFGDYDNDGDYDLLICGFNSDTQIPYNYIYRNNGGFVFEKVDIGMPQVIYGTSSWCDFDNNGWLDVFMTGDNEFGENITTIFFKNNGGTFSPVSTNLMAFGASYHDWCDFNLDGKRDLLITAGIEFMGEIKGVTELYMNYDNTTFYKADVDLPGAQAGKVSFTDYNHDNYPDICITGVDDYNNYFTRLFLQEADHSFTEFPVSLVGLSMSDFDWSDFNNDGYTDFAISGDKNDIQNTYIYRNDQNNDFTLVNKLPGNFSSVVKWRDFNNDGLIDLFSGGSEHYVYMQSTGGEYSVSYCFHPDRTGFFLKPSVFDINNDNRPDFLSVGLTYDASLNPYCNEFYINNSTITNTPPSVPANLKVTSRGNQTILSWDQSTDDHTPAGRITYNVRLYNSSDGKEVIMPLSNLSTGKLKTNNRGNAGINEEYLIKNLPTNKNYLFQVQAIDDNNAASAFSSGLNFLKPAPFTGIQVTSDDPNYSRFCDLDENGTLDVISLNGYNQGEITSTIYYTSEYYNNPVGTFTRVNTGINITKGKIILGDYNNDNEIEYLLMGHYREIDFFGDDPVIFHPYYNEVLKMALMNGYGDFGDYDNDGDLDLAVIGNDVDSIFYTIIYKNTNDTLAPVTTSIPAISYGTVRWVDYDNDLDPDLFISGSDTEGNYYTEIYINTNGSFTHSGILFTKFTNTSADFGDYNNDGFLDLAVSGNEQINYNQFIHVYKNKGNGNFQKILEIPDVGTVQWGDYDNDGLLDLLAAGDVYMNLGNDKFEIVHDGYTADGWGDYNNNGTLDLLNKGNIGSNTGITKINTPPAQPQNLNYEQDENNITLKWTAPPDNESIYGGLTYNVRVGTGPGEYDIISPASNLSTGKLLYPNKGNAGINPQLLIKGLEPGIYFWSVQAVDQGFSGGAWSPETTFNINVIQTDFVADTVCVGFTTHFTDLTYVYGQTIDTWHWDFGDQQTSDIQNPSHLFASAGTYDVKLKVNASGYSDSITKSIIVKKKPVAAFTAANACLGTSNVINNTTNINGLTISWNWNFGDGQVSTDQQPGVHYYSILGSYPIKLKVSADNGCADSITKSVIVTSIPYAAVSVNGKTTFCNGDSVVLSAEYDSLYNYQWRLDNNDLSDGLSSTYKVKTYSGSYSVRITNPLANCISTSAQTAVTINPIPVSPYISASGPTQFCQGDSVILSVTNTPDYDYQWILNGGAVGDNSNKFAARTGGTYTLEISNSNRCSVYSTDSVNVTVNTIPTVGDLSQLGKPSFCEGDSVILSTPLVTDYLYSWRNEYGPIANTVTNSYTAKSSGIYQLDVSSASGCSVRTSPVYVTVRESPVKPVLDSVNYQPGKCPGEDPVTLKVNQTVAEYKYQWFKDGVALTKDTLSYLELYEKGNYKLEAELNKCVSESRIVNINIPDGLPKPQIYAHGPAVWYLACSNKTAVHYRWYCNNVPIKDAPDHYIYVAGHKMGEYRVSIINSLGCYTSSDVIAIPSGITGIDDIDPFEGLKLYPNPTTGLFSVEIENEVFGDLLIRIYNQDGKELYNFMFEKTSAYFSAELNLSGKPGGYYLITFDLDRRFAAKKIIIE